MKAFSAACISLLCLVKLNAGDALAVSVSHKPPQHKKDKEHHKEAKKGNLVEDLTSNLVKQGFGMMAGWGAAAGSAAGSGKQPAWNWMQLPGISGSSGTSGSAAASAANPWGIPGMPSFPGMPNPGTGDLETKGMMGAWPAPGGASLPPNMGMMGLMGGGMMGSPTPKHDPAPVPAPKILVPGLPAFDMTVLMGMASGANVEPDKAGSYNGSTINRDLETEIERLRTQVELTWSKEVRQMEWSGLSDGMRILELGCGPGWTTERFAKRFPASKITCVEVDPLFIEASKTRWTKKGVTFMPRVKIVEGTALETGLPSNSFDFVTSRFVLQHLMNPEKLLTEAFRLLKPNGKIAIVDADDMMGGLLDPVLPSLTFANMKFAHEMKAKGGSRFVGRNLIHLLDDAGFEDTELETVTAYGDQKHDLERFRHQFDTSKLEHLVKLGKLTSFELRLAKQSVEQFYLSPDAKLIVTALMALGVKPETVSDESATSPSTSAAGLDSSAIDEKVTTSAPAVKPKSAILTVKKAAAAAAPPSEDEKLPDEDKKVSSSVSSSPIGKVAAALEDSPKL